MYLDRIVNTKGIGLGIVLITPQGEMLPMAKRLEFKVNIAEYEEYLYGLEAVMMVYVDSMLVIQQASKEWKMKEKRLKLYVNYIKTLVCNFS